MKQQLFKVYSDGSHYFGNMVTTRKSRPKAKNNAFEEDERFFNEVYQMSLEQGLIGLKQFEFIKQYYDSFYNYEFDFTSYIWEQLKKKISNYKARVKRFTDKANLNAWTHFCTFTYDSKKFSSEEAFKKSLRKCLSNLHTRRGWKYMGEWEKGDENGRLHFHCLLYVPEGQMLGEIKEVNEYNPKSGLNKKINLNSFFQSHFGRNDFSPIDRDIFNDAINYILKYIDKNCERVIYSRAVPTCIIMPVSEEQIACVSFIFVEKIKKFVNRYIFFDDIFDDPITKLYAERQRCLLN